MPVRPQRLRAHSTTLVQENLDLAQDKRVALESGRVVRLEVPDVGPDVLRLLRPRLTTKSVVQLADGRVKARVDQWHETDAPWPCLPPGLIHLSAS